TELPLANSPDALAGTSACPAKLNSRARSSPPSSACPLPRPRRGLRRALRVRAVDLGPAAEPRLQDGRAAERDLTREEQGGRPHDGDLERLLADLGARGRHQLAHGQGGGARKRPRCPPCAPRAAAGQVQAADGALQLAARRPPDRPPPA